jgi:tetratricopeptide (TPR) repeat protein
LIYDAARKGLMMNTPGSFLMQEATLLHQRGELAEAALRYERVLAVEKRNLNALYFLATIRCQQGALDDGIELARKALKIEPKLAAAHNLIGMAQQQRGKCEVALSHFDRAVAANRDLFEAWLNRASLQVTLGRRKEAIESFDRAIALRPNHAPARLARGTALMFGDRDAEALRDFDAAVAAAPDLASALASRGYLLNRLGRFEEAFADLARAIALAPDDEDVRYHASLVELLHGRWREGFPKYESRLSAPSLDYSRKFIAPACSRWNGEPPGDYLLVLFTEQGRGDVVQFARFASMLADKGYRVAVATQPAYASMLEGVGGIERIITDTSVLPQLGPQRWRMLMSVPGVLGITPDTIPAGVPYLRPGAQHLAAWRERLGRGFKVGISWQGSPTFVHDKGRSIPLGAFAPLAGIPNIRLISLQKHPGAGQIAGAPFGAWIETPLNPSEVSDRAFSDTSAVIANLDLVVASDSMIAHLAGALGRPAFVALRRIPDWRWLLGRDDCPWYPTARLFRQTTDGDWQTVFGRIAAAVQEKVAALGGSAVLFVLGTICEEPMLIFLVEEQSALLGTVF